MKSNLSVDSIKNNLMKKYKSSNDIQTVSNKSHLQRKNINENKSIHFICNHKSNFISFCQICSLDLCPLCEKSILIIR